MEVAIPVLFPILIATENVTNGVRWKAWPALTASMTNVLQNARDGMTMMPIRTHARLSAVDQIVIARPLAVVLDANATMATPLIRRLPSAMASASALMTAAWR